LHTVTLRAFFFTEYTQTLIYQVQLNYLVYYCMDNLWHRKWKCDANTLNSTDNWTVGEEVHSVNPRFITVNGRHYQIW